MRPGAHLFKLRPFFAPADSPLFAPMASQSDSIGFKVWGADNVVYGPVELPELVNWVQGKRITSHVYGRDIPAIQWSIQDTGAAA